MGELFENRQFITGVSGSGNNWAHGYGEYGPKYKDNLLERIRQIVEECDSLQSFFLLHSLGGGTGSGLGSYILTSNLNSLIKCWKIIFLIHLDSHLQSSPPKMMMLTPLLITRCSPLQN